MEKTARFSQNGRLIRKYTCKLGSGQDVVLNFTSYRPGCRRVALCLVAVDNGVEMEPFAMVSLNIPDPLDSCDLAVKNYSENEGMLEWLIEQKIVAAPHRFVSVNHVEVPICRLLVRRDEHSGQI
jgi:hypothetical protein